jgi:hypothetical protein
MPRRCPVRPGARPGAVSLGLAAAAAALEALAIAIGSAGQWPAATVLAWFTIGLMAVAFVLGVVAILSRRGRRWGIAAVLVSLIGNPLILVGLFAMLGGRA